MDNEVSLKLYSPLTADYFASGHEYDEPQLLKAQWLEEFQCDIEKALSQECSYGENGIDLYQYSDEEVCEKVKAIDVTVCCRKGQLMACTTVRLNQSLTDTEMQDLQDFVTGQFSDAWGEHFEQQEIRVDGGTIYVHFWQADDFSFEIGSADRLQAQTKPQKPVLPHIDLAGPDGNIYAVLGKAGQALKKAGQGEKVSEMNQRVFASGSYGKALEIIGEYVQTDFPQAQTRQPPRPAERGDAR